MARDPGFAAAYAYLAYAYGLRIFFFTPRDTVMLEKGLVTVEKALRLDPDLAEGHFARGFLLWTPASHFAHEQAIQEFRRAIALNPNLSEAHQWLGVVYLHIGLFEKANEQFRKARRSTPATAGRVNLGQVLTYQGRYEEALRTIREVPRGLNPFDLGSNVAWDLLDLGRSGEASTVIEDSLKSTPQDPGGQVTGVRAILDAKKGDARRTEQDIRKAVAVGRDSGTFITPPTTSPRPTHCYAGPVRRSNGCVARRMTATLLSALRQGPEPGQPAGRTPASCRSWRS